MEEKQRYLRWLGILCAIMAAFCAGIFLIGYKDPSVGRVATLARSHRRQRRLLLARSPQA